MNNIPVLRLLTLVILILSLLLIITGDDITITTGDTHTTHSPEQEADHGPLDGGQPVSPSLLNGVGATHREIIGNGSAAFGPTCLKRFPRAFKRGEELTEIPSALLAGIAGYESAGCEKPHSPGNIMHIVLPDSVHIAKAAGLLGIPKAVLNWHEYSEHSVVLGAVMLQDYYERTRSVEAALAAYRHGPSSDKDGEQYTHIVLAHGVLALRHQWNWVTEVPVHNADPVEAVDIRSLVLQMRLSPHPVEALPSLLAMQE